MTNEEIKASVYKLVGAYLKEEKPDLTARQQDMLKTVVDLGINLLQNINDIAKR